jgi:pimeloyl-ACP methyl ester carboxylesterase
MWLACKHPEMVTKLVVVDMSPRAIPETNAAVKAALRAIDLSVMESRKQVEAELKYHLKKNGIEDSRVETTAQFLLKSLYRDFIEVVRLKSKVRESYRERMLRKEDKDERLLQPSDAYRKQAFGWRFNLDAIENNEEFLRAALPDDFIYEGPTLFVRGEYSNYIADEDKPLITKHFPAAKIVTIRGAGHWVHADKPNEFVDAVGDFLR